MTTKTQIKDFTKGNITKQLILFALPLFLSNLLQVIYNMVDMAVVGNVLGKAGTSAVSVGGDISALMTFVAMGFGGAVQVIIARYIGAAEREKIGKFVGTATSFFLISAIIISIISLFFQDALLRLMNTPAESYEGAKSYAFICMIGLVFIYGYNVTSAIMRGVGDSKHPFIFISIAAVINLLLDVVFVVYLKMGTGGAALATIISQGISFIISLLFLFKNRAEYEINITFSDFFHWDSEMISDLLKLGAPMAIKTASIQISKLFVNSYVNSYGVAVSAFAGIANKVSSIANLISTAMNNAGSTMVGQNIASGEFKRVNKILLNLTFITLSVSAILSILICIFPMQFFSLFTDEGDGDVLALVGGFIPIAILLFLASALRAIMNALINGSGNYKINFVTAIFDGIVMRIGLSLLFGLLLDLKHYGFWLGDALAGFTPFLVGLAFYFTGIWKRGAKIKPGNKAENV